MCVCICIVHVYTVGERAKMEYEVNHMEDELDDNIMEDEEVCIVSSYICVLLSSFSHQQPRPSIGMRRLVFL